MSKARRIEFERKFAAGEYISPAELSVHLADNRRKIEEFKESWSWEVQLSYDPAGCPSGPQLWKEPQLSHDEFKWLEKNHPEYTQAYTSDMSLPGQIAMYSFFAGLAGLSCWGAYEYVKYVIGK